MLRSGLRGVSSTCAGAWHARSLSSLPQPAKKGPHRWCFGAALVGGALGAFALSAPAWTDVCEEAQMAPTEQRLPMAAVYAWGSNKSKVAAPSSGKATVNTPSAIPAFEGVGFRDMQLCTTYGAAADVHGDVVQWGTGFTGDAPDAFPVPQRTLVGKDIVRLELCGPKIYALSRAGDIYVFASARANQSVHYSWMEKLAGSSSIDYVKLGAQGGRFSSEKFCDIAGGEHHLLALSTSGHVWGVPVDAEANTYGQLGYARTELNAVRDGQPVSVEWQLQPRVVQRTQGSDKSVDAVPHRSIIMDSTSIRYATKLRAIPSLENSTFAEIAAGSAHSLARTLDGRVLGWGANGNGQLGLGVSTSVDTVAVPTEVCWPRSLVGRRAQCLRIAAGGVTSMFAVQSAGVAGKTDKDAPPPFTMESRIDLLAAGGGARGTLGNAQRPQTCSAPVRVRTVSGLAEYDETSRAMSPIHIHAISIGCSGQCALVMDAPSIGTETRRDVYVWGANDTYQLGNGKRTNGAVPALLTLSDEPQSERTSRNAPILNRLLLVEQTTGGASAYDPDGRRLERAYTSLAQRIVAGGECMAVYTQIPS
ncbi:hypothetical protein MVES1_000926 [Malassezia vespertilionis]|uniref:Uncharacterized protein n=1 Tax=Malassezia vespertilionis TaxID=2020962 RepID=A0A2N1JE39_9BASI|nr:uncharacterized protein MVES1_000926 [Malassezia vespertilionis]PKI84821.1 hypothetical protein MVES_000872 [Malassezia vespertilionis]WFD05596.1 hypothetical protein MVES1_000926 [Malassezia vespertilionis]